MKHYSPKQINQIKQEIRTGKPISIIAHELALEWKRPIRGIYNKVLALSKQTRKITNEYTGPKRKAYTPRKKKVVKPAITMNFDPMPGSLMDNFNKRVEEIVADIEANQIPVVKDICEEILDKPMERQAANIGIEVPVGVMQFTGVPSRIVVYSDHVRYYFDN